MALGHLAGLQLIRMLYLRGAPEMARDAGKALNPEVCADAAAAPQKL